RKEDRFITPGKVRAPTCRLLEDTGESLSAPVVPRVEVLGEVTAELTAELTVTGGKPVPSRRDVRGGPVKAPPASVRREHPEELAELRGVVKDIAKMLSAQADRPDSSPFRVRSRPGSWPAGRPRRARTSGPRAARRRGTLLQPARAFRGRGRSSQRR
ncbi:hypothetical protein, partial [Streptosporangium fragile]|uniref:hypothetical protein n=1 Tax=Streptosporangium fragile TaxID=46186 RepID=UPI0031EDABB5